MTGTMHSRPEFLYFWVYYVGFNGPWVAAPIGTPRLPILAVWPFASLTAGDLLFGESKDADSQAYLVLLTHSIKACGEAFAALQGEGEKDALRGTQDGLKTKKSE